MLTNLIPRWVKKCIKKTGVARKLADRRKVCQWTKKENDYVH
jgi:hypothetical protein